MVEPPGLYVVVTSTVAVKVSPQHLHVQVTVCVPVVLLVGKVRSLSKFIGILGFGLEGGISLYTLESGLANPFVVDMVEVSIGAACVKFSG